MAPYKATTLPFEVRLPHLSFTASNDFLIRTFPLQIKRDIAGLSITPPCTGKIRQVTPTTLSLIVWPLQSQSLRVGYGKLCSPSGREPTACWRAPAFRRGLESAVFKKMNGGDPFRGGAGDRTRTCNLMITRHLLYQLELHQHIGGRHCSNHLNYRPQSGPGGIRTQHLWPPVHRVRFLRKANSQSKPPLSITPDCGAAHSALSAVTVCAVCQISYAHVLRAPAVVGAFHSDDPCLPWC